MALSAEELTIEELYLRHHDALRRFLARMLRSEEAAAEVAQDAYLRLVRYAPRRLMEDPKAYLFQVAANAARDRLARDRVSDGVVDDRPIADSVACPQPNAEAVTLGRERLGILVGAVNELPPRCREVFLLSRFDGLSNGEIAQRLGISRNMVEKHVIKAMVHCRRRLDAAGK
jgi:RNA polymerase sigma-70 factor (ECF subfamily)